MSKKKDRGRFKLVDDVQGEFSHVLLHYCRAFHYLYEEIIHSLGSKAKVTVVAPNLKYDKTDILKVDETGAELTDFEKGVQYTLELFIEEFISRREAEKFLPILYGLSGTSPMISKVDYSGVDHPVRLLAAPNVEIEIVNRSVSPYCRDSAYFCDGKNIVVGNPLLRQQKDTNLEKKILMDDGFRLHTPIGIFYDEPGDISAAGDTLYVSGSIATLNQLSLAQAEKKLRKISRGRGIQWISNGPLYHLDMYFLPLANDAVIVADLAAGRQILADNGITLTESECSSVVVSDMLGLDFEKRQQILDQLASHLSHSSKVFRIPTFVFSIGDAKFSLSPLNLLSTDSRLLVPGYNIPGYERVREIFSQIGSYTGKEIVPITKLGALDLKDASIRCLVGNMERAYK